MKLGRSFSSIYLAIIIIFIGASYSLDEVWRSYLEQDIESYTGYKVMLEAVGDYLQKHPEDEWPELIEQTSLKYELPLSLLPYTSLRGELEKSERRSLKKGNTFVLYDDENVYLYHLLTDKQTVVSIGPAQMPTRPRLEALVRVAILALLGVLILFWLWPISRDLDQLRKTAIAIGEGDFEQSVPHAKSAMMNNMVNTFNMMSKRVKRLIDAHKELTNAVAHELRTPLARSKFALQMLEKSQEPEKQLRYREQIASDVNELDELINELLLYASFDSDKPSLTFKENDLSAIIEHIIDNQTHYSGSITFNNLLNGQLAKCDGHFISRAVMNYVSNAQKYGDGEIIISTTSNDDSYIISVEDNGQGISDTLKPILFDAFSRGDVSRNKETGGFGLGLAIVSRVMEWHNGKAWVETSELGGAKFNIAWPKVNIRGC